MGKVTVLGGMGFIGSHMIARLKAEGHWVRCVDLNVSELRKPLWSQADDVWVVDLRDQSYTTHAVLGSDLVYHFASDMGGVGYFFSDADYKASLNNTQIDLNVFRACEKVGASLFYASSFCAYPITDQRLAPSGRAVRAMSEADLGGGPAEQLYGEEKRLFAMAALKAPFDVRVGLFSTIYGPYQDTDGVRSKFPTAIIDRIIKAKESGDPIEVWGNGTQTRTFLYIDDAIERMCRIANMPYGGPVNVGSDEEVTVRECADWVCEFAGVEPEYVFNLSKPTGVMAKQSDNSLFLERYGDAPQTPCREGFRNLYDWMVSC